jgi:hypothetical protein
MTVLPASPDRCSALADELAEPMAGTTEHRVRWLLVEDRSAWGEKAVRDVLGAALEADAKERGIRLLLVRRRESDPAADAVRRVFLVDTAAGAMAVRTVRDLAELPALLEVPVADFGAPLADPIVLVCTNGKRDACCAIRGRALLAALAVDHGERTWECTHLGGHRFAGNLVCLPDGLVYGRVGPAEGPRLVDAYLAGTLDPARLRGRAAWPPPAQVAEIVLRQQLGLDGTRDVSLVRVEVEDDAASVVLAAHGAEHRVALRAERLAPRPISCRADGDEAPLHWRAIG